jgi:hypothetical protein
MKDETADFFESLRARGHQPLLEHIAGTLRFDIGDDGDVERWSVVVDDGDVAVSRASRRRTAVSAPAESSSTGS